MNLWEKPIAKIGILLIFFGGSAIITLVYRSGKYWKPVGRSLPVIPKLNTTIMGQSSKLNCTFSNIKPGKKKLILLWTGGWSGRKHPVRGWDIDERTLRNCPFSCDFTDDKNLLSASNAIVYHGVQSKDKLPDRNDRCFDQILTFLNIESPATTSQYGLDLSDFDNQFNWTATYRMDSDVPYPYGVFKTYDTNETRPHEDKFPKPIPTIDALRNKSLVGWMHSNCKATSHRFQLAERLQKYVPVDIFGRCSKNGRIKCTLDQCYKNFSTHYKFWLAFENSVCPDYVTEKLFYPLTYGMVPIVYAHKSVARLLPKNSFINIWDFATIEDLAKYLIRLDQNPMEYLKYFEWRNEFWVDKDGDTIFWCSFCTKLSTYNISIEANRKYYKSIHKWYFNNYTDQHLCPQTSGSLFDSKFDIWSRAL